MAGTNFLNPLPAAHAHATEALAEADRLMTVCNSCRYCEGLCAVFPAMEMRRAFPDGDLNYIANLCHGCGACYYDCQFAPPHAFNVNVTRTLAEVRRESYAQYAWPRALQGLFARNGLVVSLAVSFGVALFLVGFVAFSAPGFLFGTQTGPGAFYRIMPHNTMVLVFGAALTYAAVAMIMGLRLFWRDIGEPMVTLTEPRSVWEAVKDAGRLRYLEGAASAATMRLSARPTAGGSITTSPSTASCSASPRPRRQRSITICSGSRRRIPGPTCRCCWERWAASGWWWAGRACSRPSSNATRRWSTSPGSAW